MAQDVSKQIRKSKIEVRPIEQLVPYARNSRTHSDFQINQIAGSIKEFGFTNPVLVKSNGEIIAGHGRVLAAMRLKLTEVPCIVLDHLSDIQAKAYVLADNQLALNAGWDEAMLGLELKELQQFDFDLGLLGFEDKFLTDILGKEEEKPGENGDDNLPDVPKNIHGVKRGHIWQLGAHRLMCGDATSKDDVLNLLNGATVDLVFTDPPYGVKVVKGGKVGADFGIAKKGKYAEIIGDETIETAEKAIALCEDLKIKKQIYWGGNYYAHRLAPSSCWLIWDKRSDSGIVNTFADCELAWTNMTGPSRVYRQLWNGMIREGEKDKRIHPTQKPVGLAEWALSNFSDEGQKVLDIFGGSGSTLMACEKTKRICFISELSEDYCSLIIERWQQMTKLKAELLGG